MSKNSIHLLYAGTLVFLGLLLVPSRVLAAGPNLFFRAMTGSNPGSVYLDWVDTDQSDKYSLLYGTAPGTYQYGVRDIREQANGVNTFTVGYLNPGQTYYFKITAFKNGHVVASSGPLMAQAMTGTVVQPVAMTAAPSMWTAPVTTGPTSGPVGRHQFAGTPGVTSGTVNLMWVDDSLDGGYSLVYGTQPGHYQYGALHVGEKSNVLNQYTVGALVPGQTYYFALVSERGGKALTTSAPIAVTAR